MSNKFSSALRQRYYPARCLIVGKRDLRDLGVADTCRQQTFSADLHLVPGNLGLELVTLMHEVLLVSQQDVDPAIKFALVRCRPHAVRKRWTAGRARQAVGRGIA